MSLFRLRVKVEIVEQTASRPRDWRKKYLSVKVEAYNRQSALESVQAAIQSVLSDTIDNGYESNKPHRCEVCEKDGTG